MSQSASMSLVEAVVNVLVGFAVAVLTQMGVFPLFGLQTTLVQDLRLGAIFTLVSLLRSFLLRRLFERLRLRGARGCAKR
jgi:uncharacterized membrane protein (DUF441 family)